MENLKNTMAEAVRVWKQVEEYRASQEQGSLLNVKAKEAEGKIYEVLMMMAEMVGLEELNNIIDEEHEK